MKATRIWICSCTPTILIVGLLGLAFLSPASAQSLPVVPGCSVGLYAELQAPVKLCFAPDGAMYVGNRSTSEASVYRIESGSVSLYGSPLWKAGAVGYDKDGLISGTPGAVLAAGGMYSESHLTAILPDQTTTRRLWEGLSGPGDIAFDSTGRMLLVDVTSRVVYQSRAGERTVLLTCPLEDCHCMAIDRDDNIFISMGHYAQAKILAYRCDGVPIGNPILEGQITTRSPFPIAFGNGGVWGDSLYVIANNVLMRFDSPLGSPGSFTTIGTGFSYVAYADMDFGPDGALYVSDQIGNKILRIAPTNSAPSAEAGANMAINSADQSLKTIQGTANDPDDDAMQYRWLEGTVELTTWTPVVGGAAPLNLGAVPALALGDHVLTLEVSDGTATRSDTMTLTVRNTPPVGVLNPASLTVELGSAFTIHATAADFDGDTLAFLWVKGADVLGSGTIAAPVDGSPIAVPDLVIGANDPLFGLGVHAVDLVLDDPANDPVTTAATVTVEDSTVPTLAPVSSESILWPPNHELRPITITANASDNGGGVTLTASVASNEPQEDGGDGSTDEDWTTPVIDNQAGTISVRLRAERSGSGSGRVYTITITATDQSGNASVATVEVGVPHDRRKK